MTDWTRRPLEDGEPRFERVGGGSRIRCRICGRTGWGYDLTPEQFPRWWGWTCLRPHRFVCSCGKRYPNQAAISAHVRHAQKAHRKGHREVLHGKESSTFLPETLPSV